jgi:hypothetical protein
VLQGFVIKGFVIKAHLPYVVRLGRGRCQGNTSRAILAQHPHSLPNYRGGLVMKNPRTPNLASERLQLREPLLMGAA